MTGPGPAERDGAGDRRTAGFLMRLFIYPWPKGRRGVLQ